VFDSVEILTAKDAKAAKQTREKPKTFANPG